MSRVKRRPPRPQWGVNAPVGPLPRHVSRSQVQCSADLFEKLPPEMAIETEYSDFQFDAGVAATDLIASPAGWINRRVETVDLLSHEETRRRVSVDFTLPAAKEKDLVTEHGVVIPISVLTKEPRRNFDLRDESGAAVPVLGKSTNACLAHVAVMNAALKALPEELSEDAFELLWSDLRQVVASDSDEAGEALGVFVGSAEEGDSLRSAIWDNETCRSLLTVLRDNYVLFAVLPPNGPTRRILKYSYSEDFDPSLGGALKERLAPWMLWQRLSRPDRSRFMILCPAAWRASSFHAEVVVPEDLRIESAVLYDFSTDQMLGEPERNRNRASLYATEPLNAETFADVYVVVAPEQRGRTMQAAVTGIVVTALLWLGVHSDLNADSPDAAVSLLLAGAAFYSGITAAQGEHVLVSKLFSASRRSLGFVSLAALTSSASLAMEVPSTHPTGVWRIAAIVSSLASARLLWSAIRAPS